MKITICSSMSFAKEMLEARDFFEKQGHKVFLPEDTHDCVHKPELSDNFEHCNGLDIVKKCFNNLAESDAIVVLNYPKNGVKGYVGGATLMEIGLAHHLDKKIFLLHNIPSEKDLKYAFEIKLAKPVVINGDLSKVI